MFNIKDFDEKVIEIKLDSAFYSYQALLKCLYWYSNELTFEVTKEGSFIQALIKLNLDSNIELNDLFLERLNKDINDYNLRQIVSVETAPIRQLLIAKAFSNGEFDELPPGLFDDPLEIEKKNINE